MLRVFFATALVIYTFICAIMTNSHCTILGVIKRLRHHLWRSGGKILFTVTGSMALGWPLRDLWPLDGEFFLTHAIACLDI